MTVGLYSMSVCSGFHSSVLTHFICLNLVRNHHELTALLVLYVQSLQTFIN